MRSARADTEQRRHKVAELWLRGSSIRQMAEALRVNPSTITHDLTALRAELADAYRQDLDTQRARSVATFRMVQLEAWKLYTRVADTSMNKSAALNAILTAEEKIARIAGVLSPESMSQTTVNILAVPEWQAARAALLTALAPFPEARVAAAEALLQLEAPQGGQEGGQDGPHRE